MELLEHNRIAWNHEVKIGNQWTIPVSDEQIQEAKKGLIKIVLTPFKVCLLYTSPSPRDRS